MKYLPQKLGQNLDQKLGQQAAQLKAGGLQLCSLLPQLLVQILPQLLVFLHMPTFSAARPVVKQH